MDISKLKLAEIKGMCEGEEVLSAELLQAIEQDPRVGVRNLYNQLQKRRSAWEKELRRLRDMCKFEEDLRRNGYKRIAGVDEVGRGPLAGPVVAAAVVLPDGLIIPGLNDSKKIPEKKREQLAIEIQSKALAWSVQIIGESYIEEHNILQASLRAMELAVTEIQNSVDYVLVDAVTIPRITLPQIGIIGGDALSVSIAAASIVAKVTRDAIMKDLHQMYPIYGFDKHKGYASADHCEALRKYGPTPVHRKLFIRNILAGIEK